MSRYRFPIILVGLLSVLGLAWYSWIDWNNPGSAHDYLKKFWESGLAISVAANAILLILIFALLKWRKAVDNGMMAIVPTDLLSSMESVAQKFELTDRQTRIAFNQIIHDFGKTRSQLPSIAQSIEILKKALDEKDVELASIKMANRSEEHLLLGKKAIKLYQMMNSLKSAIERGQIKEEAALQFLADELAAVFEDLHVQMLTPDPGAALADLHPDSVSVQETVPTSDSKCHNTVASVREPGFAFQYPGNKLQVIRPALVVVHSYGGTDGHSGH